MSENMNTNSKSPARSDSSIALLDSIFDEAKVLFVMERDMAKSDAAEGRYTSAAVRSEQAQGMHLMWLALRRKLKEANNAASQKDG